MTNGAKGGFAAIQDQWRRLIAAQIEKKPEAKWEKPKTTLDTKSEKPLVVVVFFNENRKLSAKKNGKSASRNEHQNRKAEVFWHKTRLTDLKNSQNCKTENSNATLLYVVGGSSLNRNSRFKFQSCILPVDRVQNRNSILSAIRLEGYCKDLTLSEEFNVQAKT